MTAARARRMLEETFSVKMILRDLDYFVEIQYIALLESIDGCGASRRAISGKIRFGCRC